jgi:D-glycero-alpha-D-manno-heptose-7-phosphate kinase
LGGGGTDLRSYYEKFGGFVIAAAIDKYVYIMLHQSFGQELILKYSQMERVRTVSDVQHPIFRTALESHGYKVSGLEITSMADIPAGTGLGSSGSFTTALLKALHNYRRTFADPMELAEEACHIEIDLLGEPIGKQDQYIASFGGLTCFEFLPDGTVHVRPLRVSLETLYALEDNLLLFFTGYSRDASSILKEQDDKSKESDASMIEGLHGIKELGYRICTALESNNVDEVGLLMHEHWLLKKRRSSKMSNSAIDDWYELGIKNGALGGKLIGAGGGGFLVFYCLDKAKLRHALAATDLKEVRFRFDFEGTKII